MKFTVGICARNEEELIAGCLDSIEKALYGLAEKPEVCCMY